MTQSLTAGVSGMRAHQRMLDVIGSNLANVNTTGYKAGRALFSDLVYQTLRPATGPTGNGGGINPAEIGHGVQLAQVSRELTQGDLELTGGAFDFGIDGDGYFTVQGGDQTLYTRAGAFALDSDGRLVDPATGYYVQRFGTVGEPAGTTPGFQTPGDSTIQVPLGALIPGEPSTEMALRGNLPADATPALQHVLATLGPLTSGGAAATGGDLLNALDSIVTPFVGGDEIAIAGVDADGSAVATTLAVDNTTTVQDLVNAIDAAFAGGAGSLDAAGNLLLTANATGPSVLSLSLTNGAGNTGSLNLAAHAMSVAVEGKDADQIQTVVEVLDERGGAHAVNLTFTKEAGANWSLDASIDAADGVMVDSSVQQIAFQSDGSLLSAGGAGLGDANLAFQFAGSATTQTVAVDFGTPNQYDGVTNLASPARLTSNQDGYPPGALASVGVNSAGTLMGIFTNGRSFELAQLAIATFTNPQGLMHHGGNYLQESTNSGTPTIGASATSTVKGGQLEASNVDIAGEFTQMIVAQRGFSANARTITVSDEILQELLSIIR